MILFSICFSILGTIVPECRSVYERTDVPMTRETLLVLALSRDFLWAPPVFVLLAAIASWLIARKGSVGVLSSIAGFMLFTGFCIFALFLPLIGSLHGIGG